MPGSEKPAFLQHCVAKVAKKYGGDTSRAFAICTAQFQKSGALKPGTNEPTSKGKKLARAHASEPEAGKKHAGYEKLLKRNRKHESRMREDIEMLRAILRGRPVSPHYEPAPDVNLPGPLGTGDPGRSTETISPVAEHSATPKPTLYPSRPPGTGSPGTSSLHDKEQDDDIEHDDEGPMLKEKGKGERLREALAGIYEADGVTGGDHYRGIAIEAAARAFFVSAWADAMEEAGRGHELSGQELMDIAPATTRDATEFAKKWAMRVEQKNKATLVDLLQRALAADDETWPPHSDYAQDFGHYLAMESLGHGVGWTDDHEKFDLKLPHCEFMMYDPETLDCDGSLGG